MKRIWVAIVTMCVVLSLCITELIVTKNITNNLQEALSMAQDCIKKNEPQKATQYSETAAENWEGYHKTLSIFMIHDRLEEIDQSFAVLTTDLEREQYDDFLTEASRACAQLEHINDTELPTVQNIL